MNLKASLSKLTLRFADHLFGAIVALLLAAGLAAWRAFFSESAKRTLCYAIAILSTSTPLWATIVLVLLCGLYTYVKVARILSKLNRSSQASGTSRQPPEYSEYQPTPGVFVYVSKTSSPLNTPWYCKHCTDTEGFPSTLQMVHHSAAGKEYQCHKCKFGFRIPDK